MKKFPFLVLTIILFVACKKGDTGPEGPQGVAGNANVREYTYGAQNLSAVSFSTLPITTTQDTMNRSTWLVYLYYEPLTR